MATSVKNPNHRELLKSIRQQSIGSRRKPRMDPFLNRYLGSPHPLYDVRHSDLRVIAKNWSSGHRDLSQLQFTDLITSLTEVGTSTNEKCLAGLLLGYSTPQQRGFDPALFDRWLDHLVGWAEVDSLCTGPYTVTEIPAALEQWKTLLLGLARSDNIQKRRASVVLVCSPLGKAHNEPLAKIALENVELLKTEKEILITKAVSWVLRSMVKYHRELLTKYLQEQRDTLPTIAVRETTNKLKTGKKNG